jgi:hypothetical protein
MGKRDDNTTPAGQKYGTCGITTDGHACGDEPCDDSVYGRYGEPEGRIQ